LRGRDTPLCSEYWFSVVVIWSHLTGASITTDEAKQLRKGGGRKEGRTKVLTMDDERLIEEGGSCVTQLISPFG
jgi:hypothetical protein